MSWPRLFRCAISVAESMPPENVTTALTACMASVFLPASKGAIDTEMIHRATAELRSRARIAMSHHDTRFSMACHCVSPVQSVKAHVSDHSCPHQGIHRPTPNKSHPPAHDSKILQKTSAFDADHAIGYIFSLHRRGGRVVECAGFENRLCESIREFESPPLR